MDYSSLSREQLIALAQSQAHEIDSLQRALSAAEAAPAAQAPRAATLPALGSVGARRAGVGALLALLLAALGETLLRTEGSGWWATALYLLAILLLGATWAPFALRPSAAEAEADGLVWLLAAVGCGLALAMAAVTFLVLRGDLRAPLARWLWGAALLLLAATVLAARRAEVARPRWVAELPGSRTGRRLLGAAIVLLLVGAALARFLWLDSVPYGINPDEGDRSAVAMQLVRDTTQLGIFESGWYRISMMYFYLLALPFKWFGIGFVQARAFTAFWGVLAVGGVVWLGLRQWGWRVALFAGAAMAFTGLQLQFARETSEAGVTAALWVWSVALLLEGARTGRLLPWAAGGALGAWSLYFYPSGRLWLLLAAALGCYWLAQSWTQRRAHAVDVTPSLLLRGLLVAACAALVVLTPFAAHAIEYPREFALRFQETSALDAANAARLPYYNPEWSTARLLREQVARSLGVFSLYADGAGFWPMREPILNAGLALLTLLGVGSAALRWRDPRAVTLALWFGAGFVGMVLTVETPNVQRLATAAPALALAAALTLDEIVRRAGALFTGAAAQRRATTWATSLAGAALALLLVLELRFYFVDYAQLRLWQGWNHEGNALNLLPSGTLSTSLGESFHMINSGWVRLLAPDATRGGVRSPGAYLPLPEDGSRGLSFSVYPGQSHYLPWLRSLYPGAQSVPYTPEGEEEYFALLYVPAAEVLAGRGARGSVADKSAIVDSPGAPLPWAAADAAATWTATLRVPQQGNYAFRIERGPARLLVSGQPILELPAGGGSGSVDVSLARGDHGLRLEGPAGGVRLDFAAMPPGAVEPAWRALERRELTVSDGGAQGFAGLVLAEGLPEQRRQDNALATGRLSAMLATDNRPLTAHWLAQLTAPQAGLYSFRLTLPAAGNLLLNGVPLLESTDPGGARLEGSIALAAGEQAIEVNLLAANPPRGSLELSWLPPGGEWQLLGPAGVTPGAPLVQPPLPEDMLPLLPADEVMETLE